MRMKYKFVYVGIALTVLLVLQSCSKSAGIDSAERLFDTALNNTYRIGYYAENDTDITENFKDLYLTFNGDATVTASNLEMTVNGTWSTSDEVDGNAIFDADAPGVEDDHFMIQFSSNEIENIFLLSKEWRVIKFSESEITLVDKNEINLIHKYLTLIRQ